MNQAIQDFVNCKNIAVVGYSKDKNKFGSAAYRELKQRGYTVYPVNSSGGMINDVQCYTNLSSINDPIEGVFISIKPEKVNSILDEAASNGIKNIWIQSGAESNDSIKKAEELGLNFVTGKCILMYAGPVTSLHKVHRFFNKVLGKY
ncbi:MAG TPA: CoA-binding protein [Ignavibacteriaceae bacterium]|nr:CoA-binding protein [Ignavibacteriaceae bacterium]